MQACGEVMWHVDARWIEEKMLEAKGRSWVAAAFQWRLFDSFRQLFAARLRMVFGEYQRRVSVGHQWRVSVGHQ